MMTTYKRVNDSLELEIYGQISGDEYIAVGFTPDDKMVHIVLTITSPSKASLALSVVVRLCVKL